MISLAGIKETFIDYPDNESISVIAYTRGCSHNCAGCQNKEFQVQAKDTSVTKTEFLEKIIDRCRRNNTTKIVFSGGDPLFHTKEDCSQLTEIVEVIDYLENNGYNCCVYTGYDFNSIVEIYSGYDAMTGPTFFKCGCYREDLKEQSWGKTDDSFTLVSSNQYFMKKNSGEFDFSPYGVKNVVRFN